MGFSVMSVSFGGARRYPYVSVGGKKVWRYEGYAGLVLLLMLRWSGLTARPPWKGISMIASDELTGRFGGHGTGQPIRCRLLALKRLEQ